MKEGGQAVRTFLRMVLRPHGMPGLLKGHRAALFQTTQRQVSELDHRLSLSRSVLTAGDRCAWTHGWRHSYTAALVTRNSTKALYRAEKLAYILYT